MAKTSPTQRSLKMLRDRGYTCGVVEYWHYYAKVRIDLFGFIDIIALKKGETLAIQTTTLANQGARIKKILANDKHLVVKDAGWKIMVHGWRKLQKTGWTCKETFI